MGCDFCKPEIDDAKNIIGVKFVSTDQRVNYLISCEISDIFSNVEKKLYLKYQIKKFIFLVLVI